MSLDKSNDSPATKQQKSDCRSAKWAEYMWKEQAFDVKMNESLMHSCMNLMWRLFYTDYVPHLTYVKPPNDGYLEIPLSPNAKYFPIFKPFDLHILITGFHWFLKGRTCFTTSMGRKLMKSGPMMLRKQLRHTNLTQSKAQPTFNTCSPASTKNTTTLKQTLSLWIMKRSF